MSDLRYKNAVFHAIDVGCYLDSNGDGIGDFKGLIGRLDDLSDPGVTCLWLLPFYPSPFRDNGYDVSDRYGVDARPGTPGERRSWSGRSSSAATSSTSGSTWRRSGATPVRSSTGCAR